MGLKKIDKLIKDEKITKKILIDYLNKKGFKKVKSLSLDGLIQKYQISNMTKVQLTKLLKKLDFNYLYKMNKNELVNLYEKNIDKFDFKEELKYSNLLRQKRVLDLVRGVLRQGIPEEKHEEIVKYLNTNNNFLDYIDIANENIFELKTKISYTNVQLLLRYKDPNGTVDDEESIYHGTPAVIFSAVKFSEGQRAVDKFKIKKGEATFTEQMGTRSSSDFVEIIGFRIKMIKKTDLNKKGEIDNANILRLSKADIKKLKAYHPSSNLDFHKQCSASVSNAKICIYETFRDVTGMFKLKYSRKNNKEYREELYKSIEKEGEEIENAVREGNLLESLELLTEKYEEEVLVVFYGSRISFDENNVMTIRGDLPIYINNGELEETTSEVIEKFLGKKCFLYEKDVHVSPFIFKCQDNSTLIKTVKKNNIKYSLKPINIKKKRSISNFKINDKSYSNIEGVLGYDFETFCDENKKAIPYCLCLYGKIKEEIIKQKFYGLDCVKQFVDFLETIYTRKNDKKTRSKVAIPNIHIYGFNNSRFDNLFLYKELFNRDPATEYIFAGSSIKYMRFFNVKFFDISLFYTGTLDEVCESFDFKKEKGVFPYKFVSGDNLEYIGKIPSIKYWRSEEDMETYKKNNDEFDMRKYTIKYCMLDSELVYDLAEKHLENCIGEINERQYDVTEKNTGASLALGIFQQCFLEENLYETPKKIFEHEKEAYKGGRTEVFKKKFVKDNNSLYYVDRNSSYPASMQKKVPFKFITTNDIEEEEIEEKYIVDYNNYLCRTEYNGDDKNVIPNLLTRIDSSIIALKNSDYSYNWGVEIKEAINNGFKVYYKSVDVYEGKDIFRKFSEYFYNERLKIKKTNKSKAQYFKLIMNSLYGKFGQRAFNNYKLMRYSDFDRFFDNDMTKMISFEEIDDKQLLVEYKVEGNDEQSIGKLTRLSSYISADARTELAKIMRNCKHENIYYCDTDSIFTSKPPSKDFLDNSILGKWKDEIAAKDKTLHITEACFLAPKSYFYKLNNEKYTKHIKGFKSKNVDVKDMRKLVSGEIEEIIPEEPMTIFYRSLTNIKIDDEAERTLRVVYNKRKWNKNSSEAYSNKKEYLKSLETK